MNIFKELDSFDEITRFRIINAIAVLFGLNLLIPVINDLRGELLTSSVIAVMMIGTTLAVKANQYIVRWDMTLVYKLGIIFHLLLTLATGLYFYDSMSYIYLNAVLGIIEISIFTSYSIQLDEHLAKTAPETVGRFKVYINSRKADSILLGLGITASMTFFLGVTSVFIIFIIYNGLFSIWLMKNWHFFDNIQN